MTGSGSAKLSTTWLMTSVLVGSTPDESYQHRRQHGNQSPEPDGNGEAHKSLHDDLSRHRTDGELESPEARSEIAKMTLAAPPRSGVKVR